LKKFQRIHPEQSEGSCQLKNFQRIYPGQSKGLIIVAKVTVMDNSSEKESRKFIRHDAALPIEISLGDIVAHKKEYLNNISFGGLSFKSREEVKIGTVINVRIPLVRPMFEAKGKVTWCVKNDKHFDVGVQFVTPADDFKVRMLEQICHIEVYKKELRKKQGRRVTGEQAAIEWISKYADKFPKDPK
jgi:PilZ domain